MPDGTDHGNIERRHAAKEYFVAKGQEVLKIAASSGNDDDVDRGCFEAVHGGDDFWHRPVALNTGVFHLELHFWPARGGVVEDIFLRVRIARGHEADAPGQKGRGVFALRVKQSFGGECESEGFDLRQKFTESRQSHIQDIHREFAAADVPVGFDLQQHTVTVTDTVGDFLAGGAPNGDVDRDVFLRVFYPAIDVTSGDTPLGNFCVNPDRAETVDVHVERFGEFSQAPRRLWRRIISRGGAHRSRLGHGADIFQPEPPGHRYTGAVTISNGSATLLEQPAIPARREKLHDVPVSGTKRILLAAPRGYCAGVDRAVIAVEKALERYGAPVYVRKQIVHNIHVVRELEARGVVFVDEVEEVPEGSTIVFSAHGVSPMVVEEAKERELHAIDATCPLVTKVHREAVRFSGQDFHIVLIGHDGHEEVEGTMGHAPENTTLVNDPDEADTIDIPETENLIWLSQTTLSVDETMETVRRLRARFPHLQDPPSDDICYATQNRQVAIKKIAEECDLVIVVGSENSSNSVRLVEVALEYGARASYRVDYASEIKQEWLEGVNTIGVTSGASVPEVLVDQALADLADAGYREVEEIRTAEEDLQFSLPKELRKDAQGKTDERALGGRTR